MSTPTPAPHSPSGLSPAPDPSTSVPSRIARATARAMHRLALRVSREQAFRSGDQRLSMRDYSGETESLLRRAYTGTKDPRYASRYLDFVTQKYGYHSSLAYHDLALPLLSLFDQLPTRLQVAVATTLAVHGDSRATALLSDIPSPEMPLFACSLGAQLAAREMELRIERGHELYANIIATQQRLELMFRERLDEICVVGNGPNDIGRGRGTSIDAHPIVVRFNEFVLNRVPDYGQKTDIWVVNRGLLKGTQLKRERLKISQWICASNNYAYKATGFQKELLEPWLNHIHIGVIPPEIFQALIQRCNCLPSSGLAFLYWMHIVSKKRIDRSHVVGFSHAEGSGFGTHYFERQDADDPGRHIHNWSSEQEIFHEILQ